MHTNNSFWNNFPNKSQLISAHRGHRSIRAENTISAFEASLEQSDFIELDVGFTKDGVPIIIHDDTLNRTSDVKNHKEFQEPYNVIDYTYAEIKKLDFSSWFIQTDPFNTIKNNKVNINDLRNLKIQKILTLEEILVFLKEHNFPVNIEIKDMSNTIFDKNATKIISNIVLKYNMENLILFSSFNHKYIKELASLTPNITRAALQEGKHPQDIIQYLTNLNVQGYHCDFNIFDVDILNLLNANDFFVNVYTVNKKSDKDKLFNLGVKAIFTDFL